MSTLPFDQQIFLYINHLPHGGISDTLAKLLSGIGTAGVVWFVIGIVLFLREEKKHPLFFAPIIAAGGVSWALVELVIKPLVARPRPTLEMGAIIVGGLKNDFSFPSGHATIAFAMAAVLSLYEPKLTKWFYALALFISLSRIYLGVHYPVDVLAGGALGWGIGWSVLYMRKYIRSVNET